MGLIDEMKKSEIRIWCKLKSFGLSDFAVAAVMGQIFAESGLRANNLQNSANKSLGMTDEEYTAGVDNGTYTNFVRDKKGYGLCQWTFWSRKEALLKHAQETHRSIGDEEMQIEYLWTELQQNKTVKNALLTSTSIRFISDTLLHDYEQPADQSIKMEQLRYGYAVGYYDKYAGKDIEELKAEIADTPKEEPKGKYTVGWNRDKTGWWYADTEETYLKDTWKDINGHRYYFDSDGYAAINWMEIYNKWYYFETREGIPDSPQCALYVSDKDGAQSVGKF